MTSSQIPAHLVPGPERVAAANEIAARIDRIPTGRFHGRLAALVGSGTFFDGFDAIGLAVILPVVVKAFGIGLGEAGLIISAGYLGQFAGTIVVGMLSDRTGRRRAFLLSLSIIGGRWTFKRTGCAIDARWGPGRRPVGVESGRS